MPPGKAEKPLEFVAPVLGDCQCVVPSSFNAPPATLTPPKKVVNVVHSASDGTCHPLGHNLPVFTAYQLYNAPYVLQLDVLLL